MHPLRTREERKGCQSKRHIPMSNSHRNLTLEELAEIFDESAATMADWVVLGMPSCNGLQGTYDFYTCMYWHLGRTLIDLQEVASFDLSPPHLVAAGWLLSPGDKSGARYYELASFLNDMQRAGYKTDQSLAALTEIMSLFGHLGLYPEDTSADSLRGFTPH